MPDIDGLTSTTIIYNYIKKTFGIESTILIHSKKTHGLKDIVEDRIDELEGIDLLIIPDASSSESKLHNKILEETDVKNIIVLDHHFPIEDINLSKAIIVNNHGKSGVCGAGVTLTFCKQVDEILWESNAELYKDLAGIGNVGDSMNSMDREVNWQVRDGLANINNGFIKYILQKEQIDEATPKTIIFKINSFMNALIRVGTMEMKQTLIKALTSEEDIPEYNMYRNSWQSLYKRALLDMNNCKNKQKKIIKKADYKLEISPSGIFALIKVEDEETKQLTGLLASKYMNSLNIPILVVDSNTMSGSLRSPTDFRDILNASRLVISNGHTKAAGVKLLEAFTIYKLDKYILENCEFEEVEEKEYISISVDDITREEVYKLAMINNHIYGGLSDIEFTIMELDLEREYSNESGSMTKWNYDGFNIVCFDRNLVEEIWEGSSVVVSPSVNNFRGREEVQLIIRKVL